MKFVCEFHGGTLHGQQYSEEYMSYIAEDYTDDSIGRKELHWKPKMPGYLGPMWDGERYFGKDGKWHYMFENAERDESVEPIGVLRYETPEVYDMLSQ